MGVLVLLVFGFVGDWSCFADLDGIFITVRGVDKGRVR